MDKKLSVCFGEDKAKPIPFTRKRRSNNVFQLNIRYKYKYEAVLASCISLARVRRDNVG